MTNTPDPMDTMRDMWANATPNAVPKKGDTVIRKVFNRFEVFTIKDDFSRAYSTVRILRRATPAWQNAPAVMAHTSDDPERRVFIPSSTTGYDWEDSCGCANHDDLIDPVPMVEETEAKADRQSWTH